VVGERLGYSHVSITLQLYSHLLLFLRDEAASLMDKILKLIPVEISNSKIALE
jgi:hypothetical protein